jgi:hypothetical protein
MGGDSSEKHFPDESFAAAANELRMTAAEDIIAEWTNPERDYSEDSTPEIIGKLVDKYGLEPRADATSYLYDVLSDRIVAHWKMDLSRFPGLKPPAD